MWSKISIKQQPNNKNGHSHEPVIEWLMFVAIDHIR